MERDERRSSGATTVDVFAATDISTPLVRTSGLVAFDLTREIIIYIYIFRRPTKKGKKLNIIMKVNKKCEHGGNPTKKYGKRN